MVDILKSIENKLQGLVEGVFDRTFTTPVQPIEIAKKIVTAIDDNVTAKNKAKIVPNFISVILPENAYDRIFAIAPEIIEQLKLYTDTYAKEKGYIFFGDLDIIIKKGERMLISLENKADDRMLDERIDEVIPTYIIVTDKENQTETHILLTSEITIGRDLNSTIIIPSVTASRHHADIRKINEHYVLRDLGSSNGTTLNDEPVTASRLKVGDEIKIAETTLKVI